MHVRALAAPLAPGLLQARGQIVRRAPGDRGLLNPAPSDPLVKQTVAFLRALRSPAVRRGVKRAAKPLFIAALAQYLVLRALLLPVSMALKLVSFWPVESCWPVESFSATCGPLDCQSRE